MICIFRNNFMFGILFTIVSIGLSSGAVYHSVRTLHFLNSSVGTIGKIVGSVEKEETGSGDKTVTNSYPVIEFIDENNKVQRFTSDTVMNFEVFIFKKAEEAGFLSKIYMVPEIQVRYEPNNPLNARPDRSFADRWGTVCAFVFLAFVFGLIAAALFWLQQRQKPNERSSH